MALVAEGFDIEGFAPFGDQSAQGGQLGVVDHACPQQKSIVAWLDFQMTPRSGTQRLEDGCRERYLSFAGHLDEHESKLNDLTHFVNR
jgi:hypothetical protein